MNHLSKKSITLVELLVVMALIGILFLGLSLFLREGTEVWVVSRTRADITSQTRIALDRMVRETRQAKRGSITVASTDVFEFKADLNNDGRATTIRYSITGASIIRTESGTPHNMADNAVFLAFNYYNAAGTPLAPGTQTERDNIRWARITLTMEEDIELKSKVFLRNFRVF